MFTSISFSLWIRAECITELEHALLTNILMDVEYDYAFMHLPVFYSDIFAILGQSQLFREEALKFDTYKKWSKWTQTFRHIIMKSNKRRLFGCLFCLKILKNT